MVEDTEKSRYSKIEQEVKFNNIQDYIVDIPHTQGIID
jgi:hypothetical protein